MLPTELIKADNRSEKSSHALTSLLASHHGEEHEVGHETIYHAHRRSNFFHTSRKISMYDDKSQLYRFKDKDPRGTYLRTCDKLNVTPRPMAVRVQGHNYIGHNYIGTEAGCNSWEPATLRHRSQGRNE